jgi:aconitate hydratase
MAPEYGATCGIFPIDAEIAELLETAQGRSDDHIALVEAYRKAQGLWRNDDDEFDFSSTLELDMGSVRPSLAGPKRPQDRVLLEGVKQNFHDNIGPLAAARKPRAETTDRFAGEGGATAIGAEAIQPTPMDERQHADANQLKDGAVVIAAITSCTNTSNPAVMLGRGCWRGTRCARGSRSSPGSRPRSGRARSWSRITSSKPGLLADLEKLNFHVVGYGCTTCIGNSGPLPVEVSKAIAAGELVVASVISGNRNFEGRVHPEVKMNYLRLAAAVRRVRACRHSRHRPSRRTRSAPASDGNAVYLRDIWPSNQEIADTIAKNLSPSMFKQSYANVFGGDSRWNQVQSPDGELLPVGQVLDLHQAPAVLRGHVAQRIGNIADIRAARALRRVRRLDHDRPHSRPPATSRPAPRPGSSCRSAASPKVDFNSYGARRGQRRRDGARHVRQHPHQEPDARRRGRRQHDPLPERREAVDLRRGHALPGREACR